MLIVILVIFGFYLAIAGYILYQSSKVLRMFQKRSKKPPLSPYRLSKKGMLTKYEFKHRFKVNIDEEFF